MGTTQPSTILGRSRVCQCCRNTEEHQDPRERVPRSAGPSSRPQSTALSCHPSLASGPRSPGPGADLWKFEKAPEIPRPLSLLVDSALRAPQGGAQLVSPALPVLEPSSHQGQSTTAGPGLEEERPGHGEPRPPGAPTPWRGCRERGCGRWSGSRPETHEGAGGGAEGAQVGALTWVPLTCQAGQTGPGGRERGPAVAPAAAVCPTLGRARPGLRDLPPPM